MAPAMLLVGTLAVLQMVSLSEDDRTRFHAAVQGRGMRFDGILAGIVILSILGSSSPGNDFAGDSDGKKCDGVGLMLEQARIQTQFKTRQGRKAGYFLCREILRRFPHSEEAKEAAALLEQTPTPRAGEYHAALEGCAPRRSSPQQPQHPIFRPSPGAGFQYNAEPEPPWVAPRAGDGNHAMHEENTELERGWTDERQPPAVEEMEKELRTPRRSPRGTPHIRRPFREGDPLWTPRHPDYLITT